MFPTVEEYLLLDVLSNSDNNVQKAADKLVKMGYVKRDTPSEYCIIEIKKDSPYKDISMLSIVISI